MGLRRAGEQALGSLVGGGFGTVAALLGAPLVVGIPAAVGLALSTSFALHLRLAYPVTAFSALFVQAVPRGEPLETLHVRVLAVVTAACSGFVVNVVVSGRAYERIFARRERLATELVLRLLPATLRGGADAAQLGFSTLAQLQSEVDLAVEELRWRRASAEHARMIEIGRAVRGARFLLHLSTEVHHAAEAEGVDREALLPLAAWLESRVGPPPEVPDRLSRQVDRLLEALREVQPS